MRLNPALKEQFGPMLEDLNKGPELEPDVAEQLREVALRGGNFKSLTASAGWQEFEKLLREHRNALVEEMVKSDEVRIIRRYQARIQELDAVLSMVPGMIAVGEQANDRIREYLMKE